MGLLKNSCFDARDVLVMTTYHELRSSCDREATTDDVTTHYDTFFFQTCGFSCTLLRGFAGSCFDRLWLLIAVAGHLATQPVARFGSTCEGSGGKRNDVDLPP